MLLATVLALVAAALHASWNLIAKTSTDRELALVGQFVMGGMVAALLLLWTGLPGLETLPWLAASSIVHVVYVTALGWAYDHGDFSFAYPLARGGGAIAAALGGVALLGDHIGLSAWCAIVVVGAGLVALVGTRPSARSLGSAGLTAATIGTYTLIDSHGARIAVSGQSYGVALLACTGVSIGCLGVARGRSGDLLRALPSQGWRFLASGIAGVAAYTLVLVAIRHAPVGYVTMLRESSVVLAAGLGWLLLRERMGSRRLACSAVILCGLVALVWTNA